MNIFYYLYDDSLTYAFGWSAFLCRIDIYIHIHIYIPRCNVFKVNIMNVFPMFYDLFSIFDGVLLELFMVLISIYHSIFIA
jgi:hypothetical protein